MMKITIETARDGYIIRDEDDPEPLLVADENDATAAQMMLWQVNEIIGHVGGRYDAERVRVITLPGDKWEPRPGECKHPWVENRSYSDTLHWACPCGVSFVPVSKNEDEEHAIETTESDDGESQETEDAPDRVEVRRNDDDTIDEVVLYRDGRCVFHLEQNSDCNWYFTLDDGDLDQDVYWLFDIWSKARIEVWRDIDERTPFTSEGAEEEMGDNDGDHLIDETGDKSPVMVAIDADPVRRARFERFYRDGEPARDIGEDRQDIGTGHEMTTPFLEILDGDSMSAMLDTIAIALASVSFCGEHIGEAPVPCEHFWEDARVLAAALWELGLMITPRSEGR